MSPTIPDVHPIPTLTPHLLCTPALNPEFVSPPSLAIRPAHVPTITRRSVHAAMAADPIEWYPARILQARAEGGTGPNSFALIILNQPLRDVPTLKKLWKNCNS